MASRSSRKSNSSASKQKPTFRRSSGGAWARTRTSAASVHPPAQAAPRRQVPARTYVAPTKKAASDLVSSTRRVQRKGALEHRGGQTVSVRSAGAAAAKSARRAAPGAQVPTRKPAAAAPARKGAGAAKPVKLKPTKQKAAKQKAAKQKAAKQKAAKQALSSTRPRAQVQTSARKAAGTKAGGLKLPVPAARRALGATDAASTHERRQPGFTSSLSFLHVAVAAVLAGVVAIGIVFAIVVNSGFFAVTDVVVMGSDHVPQQTASQLVDVPEGTTLFNVDEDELTGALKENPWVESVHVERRFPHTLVITPTERTVAAIAYIVSDDVAWAISDENTWIAPLSLSVVTGEDGSVLTGAQATTPEEAAQQGASDAQSAQADAEASAAEGEPDQAQEGSQAQSTSLTGLDAAIALARQLDAVLLTDVGTDAEPSSGNEVTSEVVLAGLSYATGFSPEFRAQIKNISVSSVEAISANLDNGVEVSLGKPEDIQQKEQVIRRLLEQEQGVTYINVRVADAYTFRSAPVS